MKILGIDTSCDDTCVSIVKIQNPLDPKGTPRRVASKIQNFEILSNVVSSQVKLHAKYGGVYPFLAKREHQKNLPLVFRGAIKGRNFDLIGVTVGPGLEPCLWQGINFAKELAEKYKKPLIPINHIEAHILANFIDWFPTSISFPAVCLVVSGGHTQLILMKEVGKYKLIGETRDDAAGECFDKVARILGLGYPGGPAIAAAASKFKIPDSRFKIQLPRPMIKQKNYDFSFSGLKTAVLYKYKTKIQNPKSKIQNKKFIRAMATEVQQAIIDVLIHKTIKAAKDHKVKSIILGGGVAANKELRRQFKKSCLTLKVKHFVPAEKLCTDNAAMIAAAAFYHRREKFKDIKAEANLQISGGPTS